MKKIYKICKNIKSPHDAPDVLKVNTSQKVHIYHMHQHEHYASTPSSKRSLDQRKIIKILNSY
jgi:hypothetical protein